MKVRPPPSLIRQLHSHFPSSPVSNPFQPLQHSKPMLFHNTLRHSLFLLLSSLKTKPTHSFSFSLLHHHRFSSSWLSLRGNPLIKWPTLPIPQPPPNPKSNSPEPQPHSNFSPRDFSAIADIFADSSISPGSILHSELDRSGIEPDLELLLAVFDRFGSSPKLLHSLFLWAEKQPGFRPNPKLFDAVVNALSKSREFDSAWTLILHHIDDGKDEGEALVSVATFAIMIRRYARAERMAAEYMEQVNCRNFKKEEQNGDENYPQSG